MKIHLLLVFVAVLLMSSCDDDGGSSSSASKLVCETYSSDDNIDVICNCNQTPDEEWSAFSDPTCYYKQNNTKVCAAGYTLIGGSCVAGYIPPVDATNGVVINSKRFSFDGATTMGSSVWKRDGMNGYINNSLNISFWGSANPTCPTQLHGPTIGYFPWIDATEVYTPYPQVVRAPYCPETGESGSNYVTVQDGVGIGMYAHAGVDSRIPYESVLQAYPLTTPGGAGLIATYLSFNPSWLLEPWTSTNETVAIVTQQFVPKTEIDNTKTQAQQNVRTVFINKYCHTNRQPGQSCQFSWNTQLYMEGIHTEDNSAHVMFDPAQQGMAVILGSAETSPYWSSKGADTQRTPFYGAKSFHLEMSWTQGQNLLIEFTKQAFAAQGVIRETVTYAEVAVHFGAAWQVKSEWIIYSVGLGQEVFNPDKTTTAHMSGMLKSLDLISR